MKPDFQRIAYWSALGAAAACSVSIAAWQVLLGLALAAMLAGRLTWRVPRYWQALAIFAVWTLLSIALSDAPRTGMPQVKKFYAWLTLFAVLTMLRKARDVYWLAVAWLAGGTLSALDGLRQFGMKWSKASTAGKDFYTSYVADRITGFNSHWMTFSGQMMIVLLLCLALWFWGRPEKRLRWAFALCLPLVALALVLAFTRGMWIATGVGALYLLWSWKRWTVALVPVLALAAVLLGPAALKDRVLSLVKPHGQMDSNDHRKYVFRTGIEMIKAHPWFGLGPQRVGAHFREYIPEDLPKTLPEGYYEHLHNIYIHFAAERGLPAMLAVIFFFAATLWDWLRQLHKGAGEDEWVLRGGVAVLVGVLVAGCFEYNLGDSEILGMTLAAVGAVSGALRPSSIS
ncbi:MAG: O-antigen ligase family protein [Paludibaculum sp.]